MDIKALFFDIDGTILNSRGTMNRPVYESLLRCRDRGLLIGIATARSGRIVFRDHEIPGGSEIFADRGIFYNGGSIFDRPSLFYRHLPIPGEIVSNLVSRIGAYGDDLQIALQHDDLYHSFKYPMDDNELVCWGFRREEIRDFRPCCGLPTTKIIVFSGRSWGLISGDFTELYEQLCRQFGDSVNIYPADSKRSIYIVSKYATKGEAIGRIIRFYGIRPEEVAVFGDDTPDMGMFGQFGHSIAMGNAQDSLKEAASFVTRSNDEDGVVYALEKYLKII